MLICFEQPSTYRVEIWLTQLLELEAATVRILCQLHALTPLVVVSCWPMSPSQRSAAAVSLRWPPRPIQHFGKLRS